MSDEADAKVSVMDIAYARALHGEELMNAPQVRQLLSKHAQVPNPEAAVLLVERLERFLSDQEEALGSPLSEKRSAFTRRQAALVVARLVLAPGREDFERDYPDESFNAQRRREDAQHLHDSGKQPEHRRLERPNARIKAWDAFTAELADFLELVAPIQDPGADDSAEAILAEAISDHLERLSRPGPGMPPHLTPSVLAQRLRVQLPVASSVSPGAYGSVAERVKRAVPALLSSTAALIVGDPGSGKTTVMKAAVAEWCVQDPRRLGLFCRAADFLPRRTSSRMRPAQAFAQLAKLLGLTEVEDAEAAALFRRRIAAAPSDVLVAIDGLDEVDDDGARALGDFRAALATAGVRTLVSSRSDEGGSLRRTFDRFTLRPLSAAGVDLFFDDWYSDRPKHPGRGRLQEALLGSGMREALRRPVLATIAAGVSEAASVPPNLSSLYETYLQIFFDGAWKFESLGKSPAKVVKRARLWADTKALAWWSITRPSGDEFVPYRWTDSVSAAELAIEAPSLLDAFDVLCRVDGLFVPRDGAPRPHRRFGWLHRSFQEHLAGSMLADRFRSNRPEAEAHILGAAQRPAWQFVLRHAYGLMSEAERERVVALLRSEAALYDPAAVLERTIYDLERSVQPERAYGDGGEHSAELAFARDPMGTLRLMFDSEQRLLPDGIYASWLSLDRVLASPELEVSKEVLDEIAIFAFEHGASEPERRLVLAVAERMSGIEPNEAALHLARYCEAHPGLVGAYGLSLPPDAHVSRRTLDFILRQARKSASPFTAANLLGLLGRLPGGTEALGTVAWHRETIEMRAGQAIASQLSDREWFAREGAGENALGSAASALLAGAMGDRAAFAFASMVPSEILVNGGLALSAHARVAAVFRSLRAGGLPVPTALYSQQWSGIPDDLPTEIFHDRLGDATFVLSVLELLERTRSHRRESDVEETIALVPHIARAAASVSTFPFQPLLPAGSILSTAVAILADQPWETFWKAFRAACGRLGPEGLLLPAETGGELDFPEDGLLKAILESPMSNDEQYAQVIEWLLAHGPDLIEEVPLPSPRRPSQTISLLLEKAAARSGLESLPGASRWFPWVIQEGALPYWRPRLRARRVEDWDALIQRKMGAGWDGR